jgi:hypothetical protein
MLQEKGEPHTAFCQRETARIDHIEPEVPSNMGRCEMEIVGFKPNDGSHPRRIYEKIYLAAQHVDLSG